MDAKQLLLHVDHTQLSPGATLGMIDQLCREAIEFQTACACIPPVYVSAMSKIYGDALKICTVVGFPLGYNNTDIKVFETMQAVAQGASEIDMVINISALKSGDRKRVSDDILAVRGACKNAVLKVIVETCYLDEAEKIECCRAVTESGADFIKTSTGFGSEGAALSDIALFQANLGADVRIKAAGGIRTAQQIEDFLRAGCERVGSSSAVSLLKDLV